MKRTFVLGGHPEARRRAMAAVADAVDGLVVEIRPATRNTAQSARFHAICSDLERSRLAWFGSARDAAAWKVLLISGHAFATKEPAQVIPGIEGELVNVRESSALMSKARSASLIDYSESFCVANDVPLHDLQAA